MAQVNGRNAISWDDKLAYDVKYVSRISLFGDIKILFLTLYKVVKRSGIQFENKAESLGFIDQRKVRAQEKKTTKNAD